MSEYSLICGDALTVLKTLPANSVQCCVTSPPYFGLRDYGTATWEGGDANCDHIQATARNDGGRVNVNGFHGSARPDSDKGAVNFKGTCGKCGARRVDSQIGLEDTPEQYVAALVDVFREVRRVLRSDATLWLNLGDSMLPSGCEAMIPHRVAMALMEDGWICRQTIIWHKKAPMPESVTNRCTKAHEYVFLLAKSSSYFYDATAIMEPVAREWGENNIGENNGWVTGIKTGKVLGRKENPNGGLANSMPNPNGRNRRSVWTLGPESYAGAHFATMPTKLVEPCILAGTSAHGCCSACGSPWQRVVEKSGSYYTGQFGPKTEGRQAQGLMSKTGGLGQAGWRKNELPTSTTTGWAATCTCNAPVTPCTVLDCFNGVATTGVVALKHGRKYIGIDISSEFLKLSQERLDQTQPMLVGLTL